MKHPRVIACHLLNDFSGSPRILRNVAQVLLKHGYDVHLFTSMNRNGLLSDLNGVVYHSTWYHYSPNKYLRLLFYSLTQFALFFKLLFQLRKTDIVYINTVLPYGAALAATLRGNRIIYHVHEVTIDPPILKSFLFGIAKKSAHQLVCVSRYVASAFDKHPCQIIYNGLDPAFTSTESRAPKMKKKNILMVCSLKEYKGVNEFIQLAAQMPTSHFRLVVNANEQDITAFFLGREIPSNVKILGTQTDMTQHYEWAGVMMNLSNPDRWIETFGLTILEGMSFGTPAIVPNVGGIREVVDHGVTGFQVDPRDLAMTKHYLERILDNHHYYFEMSSQALEKTAFFSQAEFEKNILQLIQ